MNKIILYIFLYFSSISAKEWWENANFYQIYPRSFQDSDGDGIGDLNGITQRLEYLKNVGFDAVWLSPIFQSPMVDFGYDISDYYKIHDEYGTLEDFQNMLKKAKELGLKIILDFVPNHTSDEHEWFQKSLQNDPEYRDFYVWHDGIEQDDGKRVPPNNWLSSFRYSAWKWMDEREQFYLHQFAEKQVDLNFRNPNVRDAMKKVLNYWLDIGVDGFRIDACPFLFEHKDFPDEPVKTDGSCPDPDDYCHLQHIYTNDQPELYDLVYEWRKIVDDYTREKNTDTKVILTEAWTNLENIIKYYGNEQQNGSHVPFNFQMFTYTNNQSNAIDFAREVEGFITRVPKHQYPNWVLGNHDNKRLASRFGPRRTDLMNILLQTLPGIAITYYGEEIGMTDVYISWADTVDPQACNSDPTRFDSFSRDPARTPFQWDSTKNSGFSTSDKPWLPLAPDYRENNVANQVKRPTSHLHIFRKLLVLRQQPAFQDGSYEYKVIGQNIFTYKREIEGDSVYVIVLNFGTTSPYINLQTLYPQITDKVEVIITSLQSSFSEGDVVSAKAILAQREVGTVYASIQS